MGIGQALVVVIVARARLAIPAAVLMRANCAGPPATCSTRRSSNGMPTRKKSLCPAKFDHLPRRRLEGVRILPRLDEHFDAHAGAADPFDQVGNRRDAGEGPQWRVVPRFGRRRGAQQGRSDGAPKSAEHRRCRKKYAATDGQRESQEAKQHGAADPPQLGIDLLKFNATVTHAPPRFRPSARRPGGPRGSPRTGAADGSSRRFPSVSAGRA